MRKVISSVMILLLLMSLSSCKDNSDTQSTEKTDTNLENVEIPPEGILGKMNFSLDDANMVSSNCGQDGTELCVTDENGLVWTLSIPEGAFSDETAAEISITPLRNISNEMWPVNCSGLLLSPDGTAFLKPATLTVSGPGAGDLLLLTGDHSGTDLSFLPSVMGKDTVEVRICHFSSVFASDPTFASNPNFDPDKLEQVVNHFIPLAEKVLSQDIDAEVPDIDFSYMNQEDFLAMDKTRKKFINPEMPLVYYLFWIPAMIEMSGKDDPELMAKAKDLYQRMVERMFMKIDLFLEDYRGDREQVMIMVSTNSFIHLLLQIDTLSEGFDSLNIPNPISKQLLEKIKPKLDHYQTVTSEWANETWRGLLSDLRVEHQYKYFMALYYIADDFPVFLPDDFDKETMKEELENAMACKLSYEGEMNADTGSGEMTWKFAGEVPLTFEYDSAEWDGDGECRWTGLTIPEGNLTISPSPESLHVDMKLSIRPDSYCVLYELSTLTPDNAVYIAPEGSVPASDQKYIAIGIFHEYIKDFSIFYGKIELENGEEEIKAKMEGTLETADGECIFTLKHVPQ